MPVPYYDALAVKYKKTLLKEKLDTFIKGRFRYFA
tara:strand:+ start:445 stop:549 length:105 start_codon:yes stop_codon:yes gene_type:complete